MAIYDQPTWSDPEIWLVQQRKSGGRWSAAVVKGRIISMSKLLSDNDVTGLYASPENHQPAQGWDYDRLNDQDLNSDKPHTFYLAERLK